MVALGECLVFRLRWNEEFEKILDGESELEGLESPDETRKQAREVDSQARIDMVGFLESCGRRAVDHFISIGGDDRIGEKSKIESPGQIERNRTLSFGVWPVPRNFPPNKNWKMKIGLSLRFTANDGHCVIPWIWRAGGEKSEFDMRYILQKQIPEPTSAFELEEFQVALGVISLGISRDENNVIDAEALLEKVRDCFAIVTRDAFSTLYPK